METGLSTFGLLMSVAFVVAGLVMHRDFERKGEPADLAWAMVVAGMVGGVAAAHLEYVLHHWDRLIESPSTLLTSWSGMVWYAGLAGGVVATAWPIRRAGIAWASAADTAAPALAVGLAIARVGCHLAGDGDWGTPTTLPWAVAYTHAVAPWPYPPGVAVHPAPLYETVALLGLFAVLWQLRGRVRPVGALFAVYVVAASAIRFLVEFVRTNPRLWLGLTEAQWISLGLAAGAAAWLVWRMETRAVVSTRPLSPSPAWSPGSSA